MSEWQPIKDAPKDGTLVLLCEVPFDWIGIGRWEGGPMWQLDSGWAVRASHWMPLPTPPSNEEGGRDD